VAAGTGSFDGTLGRLLTANVFEIDQDFLRFAQEGVAIRFQGSDSVAGVHEVDHIQEGAHGVNIDYANHRGFAGIGFGDHQTGDLPRASFECDR
jgi:hypothetical protein